MLISTYVGLVIVGCGYILISGFLGHSGDTGDTGGMDVEGSAHADGADGYDIGGTMDLSTPFGPVALPYSNQGQTSFTK